MNKGYILKRLLRSVISVLLIMVIVFTLVYTLVPRTSIFAKDDAFRKLATKPDDKVEYQYYIWEKLGYLDFVRSADYLQELYEENSPELKEAQKPGSKEMEDFKAKYEAEGYTVETYPKSGRYYAYKDTPVIKHVAIWLSSLIEIDTPWAVDDEENPDLERGLSFGKTESGGLALIGSGSKHKYLLYTDSNFPWIHQNIINLTFGESYPTYQGLDVLDVLFSSQGKEAKRPVTYSTGKEGESGIIFGTLTYKNKLDRMDKQKFQDNYATYRTDKENPSMVAISFIMGIIAMIISYGLGIPIGLLMARRKDKLADKIGMAYIIFTIAVPSLAYIFLFRYLATSITNLPSVFTTYGASDIRSWVLPAISLSLPSIAGHMLWTRRYVVDQTNQDYVKFAKAKGLNQKEIFRRHILKNASIPIMHGIPASLAGCIGGAFITENIYAVGGMGKMLPSAIQEYNNTMIVALAFLFSMISVLSVLAGDILITKIDPRISLTEKAGRS